MEYKCSDISKVYNHFASKRKSVGIKDANISFNTGEIIGIVGLSSSGKSTLVDILSGRIRPNDGKLNYNGREVSRVYNEFGIKLNKNMTVYDNMVLFGKKERMSELEVESRMSQLRDIFSLEKYINTKVNELNECNRVKAELAMTLLKCPRILFVDDAFVFLSNSHKNEVLKCLKRLNKQERTVIILASTSISDVDKIINRIIITYKNTIVYDGDIEIFKNKYCNKKIFEVFLNKNVSINKIDEVEVLENSDYYYKLLFSSKDNMFANVISLFDVNNIVDLKVGNQDLIDIINEIKKDEE